MKDMNRMWDERFSQPEYAYGKLPNDFLAQAFEAIPKGGRVLCIADGEGRNGVFLAEQGYDVTSMDRSVEGLNKGRQLAEEQGTTLNFVQGDLADFELGEEVWDGIVSVFCHLPLSLRQDVHARAVRALKPGGVFLLEAYNPGQLAYKTGGPPVVEMLMPLETLQEELAGLDFEQGQEVVREIREGVYHQGDSSVTQILARKP